jgi:hypothetical protein
MPLVQLDCLIVYKCSYFYSSRTRVLIAYNMYFCQEYGGDLSLIIFTALYNLCSQNNVVR